MSHGTASRSRLEIHLLGPFRIIVDGAPVEEPVGALLALQPHHQLHREQVIELLWPELDSEAAANNLHKTVHLARRALGPESGARSGPRYILTLDQQMMPAADLWDRDDLAHCLRFDFSWNRRVSLQRLMRPRVVIIIKILSQNTA